MRQCTILDSPNNAHKQAAPCDDTCPKYAVIPVFDLIQEHELILTATQKLGKGKKKKKKTVRDFNIISIFFSFNTFFNVLHLQVSFTLKLILSFGVKEYEKLF